MTSDPLVFASGRPTALTPTGQPASGYLVPRFHDTRPDSGNRTTRRDRTDIRAQLRVPTRTQRQASGRKSRGPSQRRKTLVSGRRHQGIVASVLLDQLGWLSHCARLQGGVSNVSPSIDGGIRIRLRSTLRNRDKRHGRGRGREHNRYQNHCFAGKGLISLIMVTHLTA